MVFPAFSESIAPKMTVLGRVQRLQKLHDLDVAESRIHHDPERWFAVANRMPKLSTTSFSA